MHILSVSCPDAHTQPFFASAPKQVPPHMGVWVLPPADGVSDEAHCLRLQDTDWCRATYGGKLSDGQKKLHFENSKRCNTYGGPTQATVMEAVTRMVDVPMAQMWGVLSDWSAPTFGDATVSGDKRTITNTGQVHERKVVESAAIEFTMDTYKKGSGKVNNMGCRIEVRKAIIVGDDGEDHDAPDKSVVTVTHFYDFVDKDGGQAKFTFAPEAKEAIDAAIMIAKERGA